MFFRREVAKPVSFEERLEGLRAAGFATAPAGAGAVRVSRGDVAVDLKGAQAAPAGVLVAGEIAALTDLGNQKVFRTRSGRDVAATYEQLRAIHEFEQDLKQGLGLTSLYNESLGTVSTAYVYDRVQDRDRGVPSASGNRRPRPSPSIVELQTRIDAPAFAHGGVDGPEQDVGGGHVRRGELRVVHRAFPIGAELQTDTVREAEILGHGEVPIIDAGPAQAGEAGGEGADVLPQLLAGKLLKAGVCIEPAIDRALVLGQYDIGERRAAIKDVAEGEWRARLGVGRSPAPASLRQWRRPLDSCRRRSADCGPPVAHTPRWEQNGAGDPGRR